MKVLLEQTDFELYVIPGDSIKTTYTDASGKKFVLGEYVFTEARKINKAVIFESDEKLFGMKGCIGVVFGEVI